MRTHRQMLCSLAVAASVCVVADPARAGLVNPSFDNWSQPELPDGWERVSSAPLSEVAGFGGVGSAMLLDPGGAANNASVNQEVFAPAGTPFSASFEFIQSPGSGRGLNFELRKSKTEGLIVLRVQDDGSGLNDIDLFDGPPGVGPGWTTIGDKAVADNTRYRLTISGDLWEGGSLGSYDVLLENLDVPQTVVSAAGLQLFFDDVDSTTPIGGLQFNTGRSASAYTVDNASFVVVPEPTSAALWCVAAVATLGMKRRPRETAVRYRRGYFD